ncbi:hypothetical protein [Winogradskyella sp.]|uniref:hypothetical protein n=1 Tax=Winogradskyella sp. TaxID=1883156 RepID=UPI003BA9D680
MKKELISPLFTAAAMLLLIISRWVGDHPLDWIAYTAMIIMLACITLIIKEIKKIK